MNSLQLVKNLIKTSMKSTKSSIAVGRILMFSYNAKDATKRYDATPLVIVLKFSKSYVLGINFHWCPIPLRVGLVKWIFKRNKLQIQRNKPLELTYQDLKRIIKSRAYRPIIRLYIVKRMSNRCVRIPYEHMDQIVKTKSETFVGADENTLYKLARAKARVKK